VVTARAAFERIPPRGQQALREAKHRSAVLVKHASWGFPQLRGPAFEPIWRWWHERRPHQFPAARYADTWLGRSVPARPIAPGEPVPHQIFAIWSGDNPMSPARVQALQSLRRSNPQIPVHLVTPATLPRWLVPGQPLPPAYQDLSLVHRSDVLRAYLLHHHGGGYADLKTQRHGWRPSLALLEGSTAWLLGYTEVHRLNAPLVGGPLQRELRQVSGQLLGYGGLIARAHTPLTAEWLGRVHEVLDEYAGRLAAHPGNERGDNPGYPLRWTQLLADVVAPLTWKYQPHVLHDQRVRPVLRSYL
jgi:hypothetical protein